MPAVVVVEGTEAGAAGVALVCAGAGDVADSGVAGLWVDFDLRDFFLGLDE